MINFTEETKRIVTIEVPHSIYDLFLYEEEFDYSIERTNKHYGTYHLSRLIEDMEETDYDLNESQKDLIYEIYEFCEKKFEEEPLNTIVEFVSEEE